MSSPSSSTFGTARPGSFSFPLLVLCTLAVWLPSCAGPYAGVVAVSKAPIEPVKTASAGSDIKLQPAESAMAVVQACREWNPTGICVRHGECYRISVVPGETWKDAGVAVRPDGASPSGRTKTFYQSYMSLYEKGKKLPAAPWYALVASTEKCDRAAFLPQLGQECRMEKDGRLFFFANDVHGFYWNNSGMLHVIITRLR